MRSSFFLLAALLAGCAQLPPPSSTVASDAAAKIRIAFQRDIAACGDIVRRIGADRALVDRVLTLPTRQNEPSAALLPPDEPAFTYLLRNPDALDIGVSYHGHPWAAAWVENEAIYCAPTLVRLQDIEALGETADAWRVREFFLDKALQHSDVGDDRAGDANKIALPAFKTMVEQAAQRYIGPQRPQFLGWTRKAADMLERQQREETLAPGAGSWAESIFERFQKNRPPDERVTFLRGFDTGR